MKAIRVHEFGGPEVLKLDDVPDLKAAAGQVVVRVKAAGRESLRHLYAAGNLCHQAGTPLHAGE